MYAMMGQLLGQFLFGHVSTKSVRVVSTLPGPHDYRSAGIAPALDHVGAGVLEECQPIRVEYRGLDRVLVGTPHGSPVPWNCHRPACQRDLPLARGEI